MGVPKAELERRIERFEQVCRQAGLRATHQRMEVYRELASTDEHPDAESVYQRVAQRVTGISRDTVYRTLTTLEEHDLVHRTGALGGPTRFDANTRSHHHFVCARCGAITDFTSAALDDLPIPPAVRRLGTVESAQLQVRGICSRCQSRSQP